MFNKNYLSAFILPLIIILIFIALVFVIRQDKEQELSINVEMKKIESDQLNDNYELEFENGQITILPHLMKLSGPKAINFSAVQKDNFIIILEDESGAQRVSAPVYHYLVSEAVDTSSVPAGKYNIIVKRKYRVSDEKLGGDQEEWVTEVKLRREIEVN